MKSTFVLKAGALLVLTVGWFSLTSCKNKQPKTSEPAAGKKAVIPVVEDQAAAIEQKIKEMEKKLEGDPADRGARQNLILYHKQLSWIYENNGQFPRAISEEIEAKKLDPANPDSRLHLGRLYHQEGGFDKAVQELEPLCTAGPDCSMTACSLLGDSYLEQGRGQEAISAYKKMREKNPFSIVAMGKLAEIHRREGMIALYEAETSQGERLQARGFADRGFLSKPRGEWERILADDPLNPLALYNLACYQDMEMDPGDFRSMKQTMMAWQKYMDASKGSARRKRGQVGKTGHSGPSEIAGRGAGEDESNYKRGIHQHFQVLKKKKKELAKKLGINKLEESQKYVKNALNKIDSLAVILNRAEKKAAETGNEEAVKRAANLRRRLEEAGLAGFKERLHALERKTRQLVQKIINSPGSVPKNELMSAEAGFRREFETISREMEAAKLGDLDRDVRLLAVEMGFTGSDFLKHGQPSGESME